jgi:hypothetical protein
MTMPNRVVSCRPELGPKLHVCVANCMGIRQLCNSSEYAWQWARGQMKQYQGFSR